MKNNGKVRDICSLTFHCNISEMLYCAQGPHNAHSIRFENGVSQQEEVFCILAIDSEKVLTPATLAVIQLISN